MIHPLHPWHPSTGYQVKTWAGNQQKVLTCHQRFNFVLWIEEQRLHKFLTSVVAIILRWRVVESVWVRIWSDSGGFRCLITELIDQVVAYINLIVKVITRTVVLLLSTVLCHCPHIWAFLITVLAFEAQLLQVGKSYMGCFLFIPLIVNNLRGSCPQVFTACMWYVTSAFIA